MGKLTANDVEERSVAILKLLEDEDEQTRNLVISQLGFNSSDGRAKIERLLSHARGAARVVLLNELEKKEQGDPEEALRRRCSDIEIVEDLEDFCWKMARFSDPEGSVVNCKLTLDAWAERVRSHLPPEASEVEQLEALRRVLAVEEGLKGNQEDYYNPENSFLNHVITSRKGLPITLTAIYMFVGERIGIEIAPIGMPGHFLGRIGNHYFTPYSGAALVPRAKLQETLVEGGFSADYDLLEGTPLVLVAQRFVNNLVSIYTQSGDFDELMRWQKVLGWLQEVSL